MKWIYILIGIVVIGGGGLYLFSQNAETTPEEVMVVMDNTLPSIQILSGSAYVLNSGGNVSGELSDGDNVEAPIRLRLSEDGDASVVYPDGSSARLSPGAEIKIEEGSYNENDSSVVSKIFVYSGHVWSKVVSLATPDSLWQVETPHAVATVRGTAFDTGVENGVTEFVGSENSVDITPIDPDTGKLLLDKIVALVPEKKLILEDETNREIVNGVRKLVLDSFDKTDSKHKLWFEQNENRDLIIEQIKKEAIEGIQEREGEAKREFLRDLIIQKREEIKAANLMFDSAFINNANTDDVRDSEFPVTDKEVIQNDEVGGSEPIIKPADNQSTSGSTAGGSSGTTSENIPVDTVTIEMSIPKQIVEGMTVPYRVVAHAKDGRTQDVTKDVKIEVLGGIGFIKEPGTFVPQLDSDKRELGEVFGAIAGTWTEYATGRVIVFKTEPFSVMLNIPVQTDLRG